MNETLLLRSQKVQLGSELPTTVPLQKASIVLLAANNGVEIIGDIIKVGAYRNGAMETGIVINKNDQTIELLAINGVSINGTIGAGAGLSVEQVQDIVGAMFQTGTNMSFNYNDITGKLELDAIQLSVEEVQDRVGALLAGGANTTVTYNDAGNILTVAETAAGKTAEEIQDIVAGLMAQGANITLTYNDAGNVLTVAASVVAATAATLPNCIEFDGTPQTVDFGIFYEQNVDLGDCFYETWCKILAGGGSGKYDWSDGDGGAHAMLRNPVNGNTFRGAIVTNASNATPIVITTQKPHGFVTSNNLMYIRGILGNTAANNEGATVTVLSPTTFSINGSSGNGAYVSGGVVAGAGGYNQAGVVSFGADAFPYVGQLAHSATGFSDGMVVMYYDGVPVGAVPFIGVRICPNAGGNGKGQMGGSDHSNFIGRIAQYRIFEGTNPRKDLVTGGSYQLSAFQPQTVFGSQSKGIDANLLMRVSVPETTVADLSKGYPTGVPHAGQVRGTGLGARNERATYPAPQFTYDATIPNPLGLIAPVQPAGRVYVPLAVPSGALVFDSIERKNSTYAFDGVGGMGSTEGGSLGVKPWIQPDVVNVVAGTKPFGILNESFVYLVNDNIRTVAHVAIAQTNLDIRVSRTVADTYGMGISTAIAFRVTDMDNFCSVRTSGTTRANQVVWIGAVIGGNDAIMPFAGSGAACPAVWEVLRVLTKSDGTWAVYCDATLVVSGTDAQFAAVGNAGITMLGNHANYAVGKQGGGLALRYRNFTVFSNP